MNPPLNPRPAAREILGHRGVGLRDVGGLGAGTRTRQRRQDRCDDGTDGTEGALTNVRLGAELAVVVGAADFQKKTPKASKGFDVSNLRGRKKEDGRVMMKRACVTSWKSCVNKP